MCRKDAALPPVESMRHSVKGEYADVHNADDDYDDDDNAAANDDDTEDEDDEVHDMMGL
jgi:hypothetical protein